MTILCIASYEKGHDFLRESKRLGHRVILITSKSLEHSAQWPCDSIDEIYYMPDVEKKWNARDVVLAVSYLARSRQIDRIVPLDDFDLEIAATLREHLRVPGMGESTTRYFRDKLAMRMRARNQGLNVPDFVHVLNYDRIREFMDRTHAPWVLKPRSSAGAIGIKMIESSEEFWRTLDILGDQQSYYLLEGFVPGDIFHVDTLVYEREILFAVASGYGRPPLEVSHGGGIFTTRILLHGSDDDKALLETNAKVLKAMGLLRGAAHTEFIKSHADGKIYFLETAARVGGAHIGDLVEAATGVNLWAEWAKIEIAAGSEPYTAPATRGDYAALLVSLSKQEYPDTSAYTDPELIWRMSDKPHHVGLIVKSPSFDRVTELLDQYVSRVRNDFWTSLPAV